MYLVCLLCRFPLLSSRIAFGMQGTKSETDLTIFFPHLPHLNNVARELKCPRLLSGVTSPKDIINLQNKRLCILSFLSFIISRSELLNKLANLNEK